jgi:hypothetical protein
MPRAKLLNGRMVIVSRYRGRFVTHKLTATGEQYIRQRFAFTDECDVDYDTLYSMVRAGDAYNKGTRRRGARERTPSDAVRNETNPLTAPPPRQQSSSSSASFISCPHCRWSVTPAPYCAHCGRPLGQEPAAATDRVSPTAHPTNNMTPYVVLAVIVIIILFAIVGGK